MLKNIGTCPDIAVDIIVFRICNSVGQLLICSFIKQFGSLTWITMNLTRQFCTVLLSVYLFQHSLVLAQYIGIALVFGGVAFQLVMSSSDNGTGSSSKGDYDSKRISPYTNASNSTSGSGNNSSKQYFSSPI